MLDYSNILFTITIYGAYLALVLEISKCLASSFLKLIHLLHITPSKEFSLLTKNGYKKYNASQKNLVVCVYYIYPKLCFYHEKIDIIP